MLIVLLPLAGVYIVSENVAGYLKFPPAAEQAVHAPFYLPAFIILCGGLILLLAHPLIHIIKSRDRDINYSLERRSFQVWGYAALVLGLLFWIIAWNRFPWADFFQRYTFTPIWFAYIAAVNALIFSRGGRCLIIDSPVYFFSLFPFSAVFWWIFEYLNRFTGNWYYSGVENLTGITYAAEASLAFSTVLPAVVSTSELIRTLPRIYSGMNSYVKLRFKNPAGAALNALIISGTGLALTGVFPELLFPLLWVSPLVIFLSVQYLMHEEVFFSSVFEGDWREVVIYSLSALVCGFFWEMWNAGSLARWTYSIPYVGGFKIFDMPLPGYGGYLPFGLECAVASHLIGKVFKSE